MEEKSTNNSTIDRIDPEDYGGDLQTKIEIEEDFVLKTESSDISEFIEQCKREVDDEVKTIEEDSDEASQDIAEASQDIAEASKDIAEASQNIDEASKNSDETSQDSDEASQDIVEVTQDKEIVIFENLTIDEAVKFMETYQF